MYNYKHLLYVIVIVLTSFVIPRLPITVVRLLNSNISRATLLLLIPLTIIVDPILGLLLTIFFVSVVFKLNQEKMNALNNIADISAEIKADVGRMNKIHDIEFGEGIYPYVPSKEMGTNRIDLKPEPTLWKTL